MSESTNCPVTVNAKVKGEQFSLEPKSREAAIAVKEAMNEHGHHARVYERCGL